MRYIYIILCCTLPVLFAACKKDNEGRAPLPDGSVSIRFEAGKDTMEMPLSILSDTTLVIGLTAELSGGPSTTEHWVNFSVDTTKMLAYRDRYGNGTLLPFTSYHFFKRMTRIPAGASVSDSAVLNIAQQTKLREYTTYVLPIVIESVDGKVEGPATERVIYLVFKTGKPLFISKDGWTIADYSSHFNNFLPVNILDANNNGTYWTSNITQTLPQWITINFNREITFSAVNYYIPSLLGYPANGGYPTSIRIETSMNGTNWETAGIFAGDIANNMQTLNTGITTSAYLRYTVLESVKYAGSFDAIFISGISLVP